MFGLMADITVALSPQPAAADDAARRARWARYSIPVRTMIAASKKLRKISPADGSSR